MAHKAKKELIMLIGISGSGKSTYIRDHFMPHEVISPDDIRRELTGDVSNQAVNGKVWQIVTQRTVDAIKTHGRAILDATNVKSSDRNRFLENFPNVKKTGIVFEIDPSLAKQRIAQDVAMGIDRSKVPNHVIDRQHQQYVSGKKWISSQFDEVINANEVNEEVWRCVANTAGMVGGADMGGARSGLPPVPDDEDGSEHDEPEGAPRYIREASNSVSYSAVVLDEASHDLLLETYFNDNPDFEGWKAFAHHMTLRLGALSQPKKDGLGNFSDFIGKHVEFNVVSVGASEQAYAAEVRCVTPDVADLMDALKTIEHKTSPWHVTIAVNTVAGGKPMHSNKIERWSPAPHKISLSGHVAEVG